MENVSRRPAVPHDTLIEVFTGSQTQRESAFAEQSNDGCWLGDDHRVVAHRRASDIGHEVNLGRGLRDRTQSGPGVGGMALAVQP